MSKESKSGPAPAVMPHIMRLPEVKAVTRLSKTAINAGVAVGEFPAPRALGARAIGWLSTDIERWVASRPAAPRGRPAEFNQSDLMKGRVRRSRDPRRDEQMARMYLDGASLPQIAAAFGISRQRVHQLLVRLGVGRRPFGATSGADVNRDEATDEMHSL